MNQNRNFVASLIAAVGAFALLPFALYICFNITSISFNFANIITLLTCALAIAVFVTETIATIKFAKGKEVSKAFNIARLVLNAVLAVAALIVIIYFIAHYGFDISIISGLLVEYGAFIVAAATNGTAFGFKLKDMLNK